MLNEGNVTPLIQRGGWRTWDDRTGSVDTKWTFLCIRWTADMINGSVLDAHFWAVDRESTRPISRMSRRGEAYALRTRVVHRPDADACLRQRQRFRQPPPDSSITFDPFQCSINQDPISAGSYERAERSQRRISGLLSWWLYRDSIVRLE